MEVKAPKIQARRKSIWEVLVPYQEIMEIVINGNVVKIRKDSITWLNKNQ